jgi:uncharacterized protein YbjT (DUF2867 family)
MAVPFGITGRHTPVAADDQAGVIAGILENPASHAIAAIIGRVLGKEIKYEQVTSEKFVESVLGKPDPHLAQHLHEVAIDHHNEIFARTNSFMVDASR